MNYQEMEIEFQDPNDSKIVLRGMTNEGPRIVTTQRGCTQTRRSLLQVSL